MSLEKPHNLIYLGMRRSPPEDLNSIPGSRCIYIQSKNDLLSQIKTLLGHIYIIVHADSINLRLVNAFSALLAINSQLSFIFIGREIEKAVHQLGIGNPRIFTIFESDGVSFRKALMRRIYGPSFSSRKRERQGVQSTILVKGSSIETHKVKAGTLLGEAQMYDFSKGGAKISIQGGVLNTKDYFCFCYRDLSGQWVHIEAQVRWLREFERGLCIMGVQFIALSA